MIKNYINIIEKWNDSNGIKVKKNKNIIIVIYVLLDKEKNKLKGVTFKKYYKYLDILLYNNLLSIKNVNFLYIIINHYLNKNQI